jgi:SAM-dependent methyltransferase
MHEDELAANRELWDAWTRIHVGSDFYGTEAFKEGGIRLREHEIETIGDVTGKSLLHLQCHFGIDTLSWARLGATVTGLDFSMEAIAAARTLADEVGVEATFVESSVYDAPENLDGTFDIVYTSRGILGWLPDIPRWAQVVGHFLKRGGLFYLNEIHPVAQVWDDEDVSPGELRLRYPYFGGEALRFDTKGTYAEPDADHAGVEFGWNHSLGEIVTSLARAGLRVESLEESDYLEWDVPFLERHGEVWRLPDGKSLPLSFSLVATKDRSCRPQ